MRYFPLAVCFVLLTMFGMGSGNVMGQKSSYPSKPIRWIVSYSPGSAGDILARVLSQKLTSFFGQQIVVDNRGGANGNLGTAAGAKSTPDGYTFLVAGNASLAINPNLASSLPYDPVKDFAPVIMFGSSPLVLIATPSLPVHSIKDLISLAKAKPGQLNYASSGNGTTTHLAGELLKMSAGITLTHIPYKGGGQPIYDVISGQVHLGFNSVASSLTQIHSGRVRAIAITGAKRSPKLLDVPALNETLPGFEVSVWYGLLAPATTANDVVQGNFTELARALQERDVQQRLTELGIEPSGLAPDRFAAYIKNELVRWGKVVKAAGARVD